MEITNEEVFPMRAVLKASLLVLPLTLGAGCSEGETPAHAAEAGTTTVPSELEQRALLETTLATLNSGDAETAAPELERLAEAGNSEAQRWLAHLLFKGEGVEQDWDEGMRWLRLSADAGNPAAQNFLGMVYGAKSGPVELDFAEAAKWFRKAAEQGHAVAQENLGVLYAKGDGVERDLVQAHFWFKLSLDNGYEDARLNVSRSRAEMTEDELAEAERLVEEWKQTRVR